MTGYDSMDLGRIVRLASQFVAAQIERGEIEENEEAIRAAMPGAVRDAKQIINAVAEYLSS